MAKKTYNEKLNSPGDLPRAKDLSDRPEAVAHMGSAKMLIAAPMDYNVIIAKIPHGKVITVDRIRAFLAQKAGADVTCPLTAGIFTNVCAKAAIERGELDFPWWRTLKTKGKLNDKFPEG
jgi:alkylated DNA nucleotide flippase Atl1